VQLRECDFSFLCAKRWTELGATDDPGVRHCDECKKDVNRVQTLAQLQEARALRQCVAWWPGAPEDAEGSVMMLGGIRPNEVDLSDIEDDPIDGSSGWHLRRS